MKIKKRILSLVLAGTMALGLMPGISMTALAAGGDTTSYTLIIPSTLNVVKSGWNATDGISATGTLASGKKLTVTASSDGEFALVNQSDNMQKVGYKLAIASSDTNATTSWTFDSLSSTAIKKDMGIIVEDYSSKPAGTYTDTVTFTASVVSAAWDGNLSTLTTDATATNGVTITGTLQKNVKVTVADGATVTLKDATINGENNDSYSWAGITCAGDAIIILEGTNKVTGFYKAYPGIYVAEDKTLIIRGIGSLTASANGGSETEAGRRSAGIGGGFNKSCGNINIQSGTITAIGGMQGAGIGSGYQSTCGTISITGGDVTATGGQYGAGIGSGTLGSCGAINISGGTVVATGGDYSAGIGAGNYASCSDITITNGVTSVTATKGTNAPESIGKGVDNQKCGTVSIDTSANVTQK